MLAVNVGDDGEDGRELEERAVAFVGLGDQVLRFAEAGVGAHGIHASADHDGGIEAAGGKHGGDHRGGGGLAVHAGDRDAVLQAHQFGEHLGARNDGNVRGAGRGDFGIVGANRRADDNHFGAGDVVGAVAFEDDRAERGQTLGDRRGLQVGAGNLVAEVEQDLGNAAHADAADADEVHALDFGEQAFSF